MNGLLEYKSGVSILHKLNPVTKLILSFVLCAVCFISQKLIFTSAVILLNFILAAISGILRRSLKAAVSLLKLSAVLFTIQVLTIRSGEIVLTLFAGLYITREGLYFSALFVLRLIAIALPLTTMFAVTRLSALSNALTNSFGLPFKYAFVITTAIRFIPLFAEEMSEILEAQTARGIDFDTKNIFKKIKLIIPLCVPLLMSSVRKIENGAVSAELRGFHFRKKNSAWKKGVFTALDVGFIVFCLVLIAAAVLN